MVHRHPRFPADCVEPSSNLGVEEVFWVVASNLWLYEQGTITSKVGMRNATTNGFTPGQRRNKKNILSDMSLIANGGWLQGKNLWGNKEPEIYFVSLCPPPKYDGARTILRHGFGCNTPAIHLLEKNHSTFIKEAEGLTRCEIITVPFKINQEDMREIGFVGTDEEIKAAYMMIYEKLMEHKSDQIYVHQVSNTLETYPEEIQLQDNSW